MVALLPAFLQAKEATLLLLLFFLSFSSLPRQSLCLRFGLDRLIVPDPTPDSFAPVAAPVPTSGGILPKLPSEGHGALSPAGYSYDPILPVSAPAPSEAPLPEAGGAVPFISSNPAVPIPTGITDTATILPLPSPGANHALATGQGSLLQIRLMSAVLLMILSFYACI